MTEAVVDMRGADGAIASPLGCIFLYFSKTH